MELEFNCAQDNDHIVITQYIVKLQKRSIFGNMYCIHQNYCIASN